MIADCTPADDGRMVIGTAGWSIPRRSGQRFPGEGTHLQRYAGYFRGTEINSSFHRPHARATYQQWAAATPDGFKFAVKLTRAITHEARLMRPATLLERFLDETSGLAHKRGPILVQLPPSLAFDARIAGRFFECVRRRYDGPLVCEPRHPTWALPGAEKMLARYRVARVAADPPREPALGEPGGWDGIVYFRLHGAPRTYWSSYPRNTSRRLRRRSVKRNRPQCGVSSTTPRPALRSKTLWNSRTPGRWIDVRHRRQSRDMRPSSCNRRDDM